MENKILEMQSYVEIKGEQAEEPTVNLYAALDYAKRGWPVSPVWECKGGRCSCGNPKCSSPGKHPRTSHGVKDATTDADQIRKWWTEHPHANIGVATGAQSGIFELDVDPV